MEIREFQQLGLYDPQASHADHQLRLLEFLVELGATTEDLVAYRDELPSLASVLALRGGPTMTIGEAAARSGVTVGKVKEFMRAAGFSTPGQDDRVVTEGVVGVLSALPAANALFGEEVVLQLIRVMGASMARLADAIVSAFLVNIEPEVRRQDPVGLGVARANAEAVALLPVVAAGLDMLLRQHLIVSRRTILGEPADSGYETRQLCVGFIDLVESTRLGQRLSSRDLGVVLSEFERLASDTVTEAGGRVVKFIGDEVLFTAADPNLGCAMAGALVAALRDHASIPPVRAGLAAGLVMLRDGDVFGPVVNLAARLAECAGGNEIVVSADLAAQLSTQSTPLGVHQFKGFADPIEVYRVEC